MAVKKLAAMLLDRVNYEDVEFTTEFEHVLDNVVLDDDDNIIGFYDVETTVDDIDNFINSVERVLKVFKAVKAMLNNEEEVDSGFEDEEINRHCGCCCDQHVGIVRDAVVTRKCVVTHENGEYKLSR